MAYAVVAVVRGSLVLHHYVVLMEFAQMSLVHLTLAIQRLEVITVLVGFANAAIILHALAVLLHASMELAWEPEMILQTKRLEKILVMELFVSQTVIIV